MRTPTSPATDPAFPAGRRRDRTGGFTLIEVVLALAVIGLVAALALPAARPGAGAALLRVKASEIAAVLRADRNAALRSGRTVVTRLDPAERLIHAGASGRVLVLPAGVPLRVSPSGATSVRFSADGRSSGGEIGLGAAGRGPVVTINPATAAIQVRGR